MLVELERIADPSDAADNDDIRALADLCRFVASECARLNLEGPERSALNLATDLAHALARHRH